MSDDMIWLSVANVHKIVGETDRLWAELSVLLGTVSGDLIINLEDTSEDSIWDDEKWLCHYDLLICPTKFLGSTNRWKHLGNLSFAVSFWRDEDERGNTWPGAHRSKFYAGFCPRDDFWEKESLLIDGLGASPEAHTEPPYLWVHDDEKEAAWNSRSWFFCTPLEAIRDPDDLEREVMRPLLALIRGESQRKAFGEGSSCFSSSVNA